MVGASKIDETTDDLERLYELFDLGMNNSQIQRIYRTSAGLEISRTHISQIRRGIRWNPNNRSFLMKAELEKQDSIQTKIGDTIIKTTISQVISDTSVYHIYLTYVDDTPIICGDTKLMLVKPTTSDLIEFHLKKVNESNRQNRKTYNQG